jgi:2,4-dienoyl-CoA reductase-like NADH-dependent reductase (Old Yellow Enzyme family)
LTVEEIKLVVQQFREGAQRAKKAGFDGLELHGAHGYLVDQFFQQSSNKRTDDYGGSVENRARFALEVIDALLEVYPASRLGIKVTPIGRYNDMYSPDPVELYTYLFAELDKRGIAFVELKNDDDPDTYGDYGYPASKAQIADIYQTFRPLFKGLIVGNLLTLEAAEQLIKDGLIDLATFGRLYIASTLLTLTSRSRPCPSREERPSSKLSLDPQAVLRWWCPRLHRLQDLRTIPGAGLRAAPSAGNRVMPLDHIKIIKNNKQYARTIESAEYKVLSSFEE